MILNRPLTSEEQLSSQRNYIKYCAVNGFSYLCLGETILILFAVNLHCDDTIVAILGGMIYFSYTLVPIGKMTAARVGAARSQANFWVMRNIAALIVAMAAPVAIYLSQSIATALIVLGAFLFYGCRAAGVVMSQPLLGEICEKPKLGGFISRSWVYFYSSGLTALLLISYARHVSESTWVLFGIIITGTIFGFVSSGFIRKIHETGQICEYARQPIFKNAWRVCKTPLICSQLLAGMICNLSVILVVPISMLTLKRGYNISDSEALLYSLFQFGAAIGFSWILSKIADRFGGRTLCLAGFYGFYVIALFWILAPANIFSPLLILPFIFCPCGGVVCQNSLTQYFLETVPKEQQVVASIAILVGTGIASGLCGMMLSSVLLKLAAAMNTGDEQLLTYKYYYLFVLALLPLFGIIVHRLRKKSQL